MLMLWGMSILQYRSPAVGWRSVMISRPAKLRREHFSLAIEQDQTAFVPFEDIACH